jgi:hypothetical protein
MRAAPLGLLAFALACNRLGREAAETVEPRIELRDGQGELRLAVYATGDGFRWIDRVDRAEARLVASGGALRGLDPQRGPLELLPAPDEGFDVRGPTGMLLKLRRIDGFLRLGDGAGIPLARVASTDEEAVVRDAGGTVIARARRGGGRISLVDREGATIGFVLGDVSLERAALVVLPTLSAGERALLLLGAS